MFDAARELIIALKVSSHVSAVAESMMFFSMSPLPGKREGSKIDSTKRSRLSPGGGKRLAINSMSPSMAKKSRQVCQNNNGAEKGVVPKV